MPKTEKRCGNCYWCRRHPTQLRCHYEGYPEGEILPVEPDISYCNGIHWKPREEESDEREDRG